MITCWGKPCYILIDNSAKFSGCLVWISVGLGIIHYYITIGKSKANGQVERIIWMLKD